jgi:hypothetical protein
VGDWPYLWLDATSALTALNDKPARGIQMIQPYRISEAA